MTAIASVAIDSPLPQLDKSFDYIVPPGMTPEVGLRVKVPFGRATKAYEGFIVELKEASDFAGNLAEISEVISPIPLLTHAIFQLCSSVAARQASTLHDVLKLAVPKRAVRVEKLLSETIPAEAYGGVYRNLQFASMLTSAEKLATAIVEPRAVRATAGGASVESDTTLSLPGWVATIVQQILEQLCQGKSSIVVVPDFRDRAILGDYLRELQLGDLLIEQSSDLSPTQRYLAHLRALTMPLCIVVGSRAASYAPVRNLGLIVLWDDTDESHIEPTAPYLHSRELLLIRQQVEECRFLVLGHSRSIEVARLVEIGYLKDVSTNFAPPRISVTESQTRFDETAFAAIRQALEQKQSVLVQVANKGMSTALFCRACTEPLRCVHCGGLVVVSASGQRSCRWCSGIQLEAPCSHCGSNEFRSGRAGSTRTSSELGKSFPGTTVIEASGDSTITSLEAGKRIVVATPGAAPHVVGGYGAVVLVDCAVALSRESLRAGERALASWCNSISLLSETGRAVAVGLGGKIGRALALWDLSAWARSEYQTRKELRLPPAVRIGSVTAESSTMKLFEEELAQSVSGIDLLGSRTVGPQERRTVFRFDYGVAKEVAQNVKAFTLRNGAGATRTSGSGRVSRAIRVRLDDSEVV